MTDLKVGIPNLLISIEMAIFSIIHVFSFTWKPYVVGQQVLYEPVGDKATYRGGPFGIVALFDAFNPWDQIKAVARGIRWLFIGRKNRMLDPSYHRQAEEDESIGLKPNLDSTSPRMPPVKADEEEQVLLANAQAEPISHPYHSSSTDLGAPHAGDDGIHYYEPRPMDDQYQPYDYDEARPPYPADSPSHSPAPGFYQPSYRPFRPQGEEESPFRPPPRE